MMIIVMMMMKIDDDWEKEVSVDIYIHTAHLINNAFVAIVSS